LAIPEAIILIINKGVRGAADAIIGGTCGFLQR
jgi:hypothetical protein